jgi:uncharacterized membrane protein
VSSFLVNKFGCRAVTIAGSILASACLLVSVWANSIVMLYFTAGIGTGMYRGRIGTHNCAYTQIDLFFTELLLNDLITLLFLLFGF